MSTIRLVFLGTSAAVPQKDRFLSSISLQLENGEILLFDCGEGTQYQLLRYKVNFQKITKILFSHLHGDHFYGILGLLTTMRLMERKTPLVIYGPPGTKRLFERLLGPYGLNKMSFPLTIQEIANGLVCDEKDYRIYAQQIHHSVYCLGYCLQEKDRCGRFHPEEAKKLGVKRGPKWRKLQEGEAVLSKDNKVVLPEEVLGEKRRGFKIVIAYDGRYQKKDFVPFAREADILVLEATFSMDEEERAIEHLHSTASWSAQIGKAAKAKRLYLTHISARFKETDKLKEEAEAYFPGVVIADDGLEVRLNRSDLDQE
jgi:ribonuclease Z